MPHETAAISAQVLCTPFNYAPVYFIQRHMGRVHVCLAATCHQHFWQSGWDLLCATVVTQGRNRYRNKSQYRKLTLEMKINNNNSYIALYPVNIYKLAALYIINIKFRLTIKKSTSTINAYINIKLTTTKISCRFCQDSNLRPLDHVSGALTTEQSLLSNVCY